MLSVGAFSYVSHIKRKQNTHTINSKNYLFYFRQTTHKHRIFSLSSTQTNADTLGRMCIRLSFVYDVWSMFRTLRMCVCVFVHLLAYSVFCSASRTISECYLCLSCSMCNNYSKVISFVCLNTERHTDQQFIHRDSLNISTFPWSFLV